MAQQPGTVSRVVLACLWLPLAAAMVAVPLWLGWTRWPVILNGHPVTLVVTLLCALLGLVALGWAVATLVLGSRSDRTAAAGEPGHRDARQLRRGARWRIALGVPALMLGLATVSLLAYARPLAAAPVAVAATHSGVDVRVADRLTWYELQSARKNSAGREVRPTVGLVFYPGARVDARAYARLLRPLAAAGYLVVVLKEPFGLALTEPGQAGRVLAVHPEIRSWAVGGHSLGGVAASSFADTHEPEVKALLLYAAYPASRLDRRDLKVLSVAGSADGLATPADVAEHKADLPAGTTYVTVQGGVHSYFGDYGVQPGDGTPTVDRATAQAQVVEASRALLASLVPRPKR